VFSNRLRSVTYADCALPLTGSRLEGVERDSCSVRPGGLKIRCVRCSVRAARIRGSRQLVESARPDRNANQNHILLGQRCLDESKALLR